MFVVEYGSTAQFVLASVSKLKFLWRSTHKNIYIALVENRRFILRFGKLCGFCTISYEMKNTISKMPIAFFEGVLYDL